MTNVPQNSEAKPRAAGYIRVSSKPQAESGLSLEGQENLIRELAARKRWKLVEIFVDKAEPADAFADRPQAARLLAAVDDLDYLIAWRFDRLGRDAIDMMVTAKAIRQRGCSPVSVTEPSINEAILTADSEFKEGLDFLMAQRERRVLGERVSMAAKVRAQRGIFPGGRFRPYGYRRTPDGLVIVPAEKVIVVRIYREFIEGASQHKIARRLNRERVRTSEGKSWSQGTVGRLLAQPLYYGGIVHRGEVVCERGNHDPILERDLWDQAQRVKAERASGAQRGRLPKGQHLFTRGLLRCRCGYALLPRTLSNGEYYHCRGRVDHDADFCDQGPIPREAIDMPVLAHFERIGLDVEATRQAFAAAVKSRAAQIRASLQDAERAEHAAAAAFKRIKADYKGGDLSAADWSDFRKELTEEHQAAVAEVERLRASEREVLEAAELRDAEEEVLRWLADLRAVVAGTIRNAESVEAARAALRRLFDRFTLRPVRGPISNRRHPGLVVHKLIGGELLEIAPVVKPHAVAGYTDEGLPLVLHRTAIDLPGDPVREMTPTG